MAKMDDALALAQAICWDEGYGYRLGGHAASHSDGVDCGGLVFHCLHAAGYNVADTSPGTHRMPALLTAAGFVGNQYSGNLSDLQHGDIITMNTTGHGHTCFICENIQAYVNGALGHTYCNGTIDNVALAKVEASYDWDPDPGDQNNGLGCHPEVWCHAFGNLYDPDTYDISEVYVWRDPNYTPGGGSALGKKWRRWLYALKFIV